MDGLTFFIQLACRVGEVTAYWVAVGLFAIFLFHRRGRNGR